jgi:NAD+ synthetase
MKVALAQINTTIGDFEANIKKITRFANDARDRGAELIIFPEQTIPGYPAHDLLERSLFIEQNVEALKQLSRDVSGIGMIVGFAEPLANEWGKGLSNSAALIHSGNVSSLHRKSLLPTYDVFDESRYFDPAESVSLTEFGGIKLGITICEDVWNDPHYWSRRLYPNDPVKELVRQGAEIIINSAASPFSIEKRSERKRMLIAAARNNSRPLLFVNSVGGNDELIFDGASLAIAPDGSIIASAKEFEEDLIVVDLATGTGDHHVVECDEDEACLNALVLGTRDYCEKTGFKRALVGLSGGVDSALVLVIAVRALGKENVEAVLMPSRYSSEGSVTDALALADNLGVRHRTIPIDGLFSGYLRDLTPWFEGKPPDVTEENLQARIRGNILMALSNKFGHLVLTTGNKSEMAAGYCTLYGDMAGGLAVLCDVPKTTVYRICRVINREREIIPSAILDKPPSAELRPNQTDQDSLPPYDLLDDIIERHIVGKDDEPALVRDGFDPETTKRLLNLIRKSEYKRRQAAPGLKLTYKAFGYGRRIPLAQRWKP